MLFQIRPPHCKEGLGGVQQAADKRDADQAISLLGSAPWLEADPLVRDSVIGALFAEEEYWAVLEVTDESFPTTANARLYQALAQIALRNDEEAEETLRHVLRDRPYDVDLYEAVRGYISENAGNEGSAQGQGNAEGVGRGLTASFPRMFNEEARRANELAASGRASWLSNQRTVELL